LDDNEGAAGFFFNLEEVLFEVGGVEPDEEVVSVERGVFSALKLISLV
jgi:hypothetical protein